MEPLLKVVGANPGTLAPIQVEESAVCHRCHEGGQGPSSDQVVLREASKSTSFDVGVALPMSESSNVYLGYCPHFYLWRNRQVKGQKFPLFKKESEEHFVNTSPNC